MTNAGQNQSETIALLMGHRSIRQYTDEPIPEELFTAIIRAAQQSSTSSNVQAYSIIRITDAALRAQLAEVAGHQQYVTACPEFLVWCADMERLRIAAGIEPDALPKMNAEWYTIGVADAALASQHAAVAAESLGLGICYIGGIRNDIARTSQLLGLPKRVVPLFGMCMGYPAQEPVIRPRLPIAAVLHENRYDASGYGEHTAEYDRIHADYMRIRSGGRQSAGWSEQMAAKLQAQSRKLGDYLGRQGFELSD